MSTVTTALIGPRPRIAVDHLGKGELVLFLHGIGGHRTNWRDQLPAVGQRYLAAAWDARGWGDSDDYEGPLRFEDFASDVGRVMDHFGATKAHLVGLSMGGLIAMDFYFRRRARVASLVLCDTSPGLGESHSAADIEEFLRLRKKPLIEGRQPADIAPTVARTLIGTSGSQEAFDRLVASLSALHKDSYLKALETVSRHVLPGRLEDIDVPCYLIVGADDRLTTPAVHAQMQRRINGAGLTVIPKAGHLANIEQPDAFNRCLLAFLDRVKANA